jgi:hypothetical protein
VKEVSSDAMFDSLISGNGAGSSRERAAPVLSPEGDASPAPQKKQGMFIYICNLYHLMLPW